MKRTIIIESIIFLYSILFLYTGISKFLELNIFKENIAQSPILAPLAIPIATGIPFLEILVTAMLIIPKWRLKGLFAAITLMIIFTVYVTTILLFDKDLRCSCGGIIQQLSWPQHLVFNSIFILLAIWAIVLQKRLNKQQQFDMTDQYRIADF